MLVRQGILVQEHIYLGGKNMSSIEAKAFPNDTVGMLLGAILVGIGLFLIGAAGFSPAVRVIGLILVLIGAVIFAL